MVLFSLLSVFFGVILVFYGLWFMFITIINVIFKGKYTPFILIISSLLTSIGITIFMLGILL